MSVTHEAAGSAQSLRLTLATLDVTHRAGRAIGEALPREAVALFSGEMGAGKTTLIKAICEGLGVAAETVISPTYTLVNIYPGRWPVYHVDLFRIERPEALLELDRDDWINPGGPTLIEWPEIARPLLAGVDALEARLSAPTHAVRELALGAASGAYANVFRALERLGASLRSTR